MNILEENTRECITMTGVNDEIEEVQATGSEDVHYNDVSYNWCMNESFKRKFDELKNENELCTAVVSVASEEERICKCINRNGTKKCSCIADYASPEEQNSVPGAYIASGVIEDIDPSSIVGPVPGQSRRVLLNSRNHLGALEEQRGYFLYHTAMDKEEIIDPQHLQVNDQDKLTLINGNQINEVKSVGAKCQFNRVKCKRELKNNRNFFMNLVAVASPEEISMKSANGYLMPEGNQNISAIDYENLEFTYNGVKYKCPGNSQVQEPNWSITGDENKLNQPTSTQGESGSSSSSGASDN